ncbi:hypothetical protein BGZ61DRAFT_352466 [Ilyonectria robusta]|uniref:uncharacterized protein n=1 Tax=Ilyonectria robusta TaxID=1079257 RepID=UPI001E8CAA72|nr:uncharacterized protein BGZ61DRAFT_352466 [Ilyonectria robusta]KAH8694470.1 hypothetical protein BGZ61DRAFT_352466 [Ilyonectria robusta]
MQLGSRHSDATNENDERTPRDTETLLVSPESLRPSHISTSSRTTAPPIKDQDQRLPPSAKSPSWIRSWDLEVIAVLTSISALIALVVVLAVENDKPLSTWPLPISLNTVVSLLARNRHWVSFGAAVTLGLLVLDPFIQGVISYEGDNSTVTDTAASILRASTLDIGYDQFVGAITIEYEGTKQRLISTSYERVADSWQSSLENAKTLKAVEDEVGNSLAPFAFLDSCDIVPRTDLQLKVVNGSVDLPNQVQQVFNITQKSIQSTMAGLDSVISTSINKVLSNSTNITASFENSARLMSYRMGEIDSSRVSGTAEQWVVYIRVRWPFLAAPIAMVLGGVIFATGVIVESQKLRLDIFKADPLKMLVCGLDDETRGFIKVNKMSEKDLKKATMGLSKGEDGVELHLKSL